MIAEAQPSSASSVDVHTGERLKTTNKEVRRSLGGTRGRKGDKSNAMERREKTETYVGAALKGQMFTFNSTPILSLHTCSRFHHGGPSPP